MVVMRCRHAASMLLLSVGILLATVGAVSAHLPAVPTTPPTPRPDQRLVTAQQRTPTPTDAPAKALPERLSQTPAAVNRPQSPLVCLVDGYEPNDLPTTATALAPNADVQHHTLEPATDADWFSFDATVGWVYVLRTQALAGSTDTILTLFDTDASTPVEYNDDIVPGVDLASQIIWRAAASGR